MTNDPVQDGKVTWRDLREFRAIDLDASFVLSWTIVAECLQLELDAVLLPEHPLYEKPRPSQMHCMRAAILEFPFVEELSIDDQAVAQKAPQAALAALQPALLHSMQVKHEGHYVLGGDFGTVAFRSERPVLRLLSH